MLKIKMSVKYIIMYEYNCPHCGKIQEFFSPSVYSRHCLDCGVKIRPLVGEMLTNMNYRRICHFLEYGKEDQ